MYTLKQWRKIKGLTMDELAKLMNKSKATIWSWETGKTEPTVSDYYKLKAVFNLSDSERILFCEDD